MKKGLNTIFCIVLVLLFFSTLIKINKVKNEYKVDKVLVAEKNVYSNEKNFSEEFEKLEKEEQTKLEKEKQEKLNKEKQLKAQNNIVKKVSTKTTVQNKNNNNNNKQNNTVKYGTYGRLYVSNYNVALYDYNVNTKSSSTLQTIVDHKDSAAYYTFNNRLVIADHNYQGFSVLINLKVGTTSYIKFKDGKTIKYKLIKKSEGKNTGPDLVDTKGNSFFDMKSDIIMYTCYKDGIMVTLWSLA